MGQASQLGFHAVDSGRPLKGLRPKEWGGQIASVEGPLGQWGGEATGRPLPQSRRRGQSSAPVDGLKRCLTLKPLVASQVTHTVLSWGYGLMECPLLPQSWRATC